MAFGTTEIAFSISAIITVAIYSYLYRENTIFRYAEHLLLGTFTGHTLVMAIKNIQEAGIDRIVSGSVIYIIPVILGLLFFSRYVKGYEWLARYSLSLLIGITAGVEARARFHGWIWQQVSVTISQPLTNLTNIIIIITMFATMSYFTFTVKHTGVFGQWTKFGRALLMLIFGMGVAYNVSSRTASVTARFSWLLTNTPVVLALSVVVLGAVAIYEMVLKKPETKIV